MLYTHRRREVRWNEDGVSDEHTWRSVHGKMSERNILYSVFIDGLQEADA